MTIGTIVKSNSHISYLCRVFGRLETGSVPTPEEYAFGRFVAMRPIENGPVQLIGVIRDTILVNPDYGNAGPRLSGDTEIEVFSPDYLSERGVLVEIMILGWNDGATARH